MDEDEENYGSDASEEYEYQYSDDEEEGADADGGGSDVDDGNGSSQPMDVDPPSYDSDDDGDDVSSSASDAAGGSSSGRKRSSSGKSSPSGRRKSGGRRRSGSGVHAAMMELAGGGELFIFYFNTLFLGLTLRGRGAREQISACRKPQRLQEPLESGFAASREEGRARWKGGPMNTSKSTELAGQGIPNRRRLLMDGGLNLNMGTFSRLTWAHCCCPDADLPGQCQYCLL